MQRLPTDRQILRQIYDRYHKAFVSFDPAAPSRRTKVYVPIDIPNIAASLNVDPELIFGRLHYHLEPKYGQPGGKPDIHFFFVDYPRNKPDAEHHVVNFPVLESVLASLEYQHRKIWWATAVSVISVSVAIIALAASIVFNLFGSSIRRQDPPRTVEVPLVERGAYVVQIGGCNDSHTPKLFTAARPEPDKSRLLSGHPANAKLPPLPSGVIGADQWGAIANNDLTAWAGPWGMSYAANLTPDATGLASWTPENFIGAMRTGKHLGAGRPILPPMPWVDYARMTDEDLLAVFTYLKSLPPISNAVPAPVPPAAGSAPG